MSGLFNDGGDINFLAIIDLNCDAVSVAAWTQHRLLGVLFHFLAVKHLQIHIFEMHSSMNLVSNSVMVLVIFFPQEGESSTQNQPLETSDRVPV